MQYATAGLKYATPILVVLLTNSSGSRWPGRPAAWPNNAWCAWDMDCEFSKWRGTPALHLMIIHWGDYSGVEDALKANPSPFALSALGAVVQARSSAFQCACMRSIAIIYRPLPSLSPSPMSRVYPNVTVSSNPVPYSASPACTHPGYLFPSGAYI